MKKTSLLLSALAISVGLGLASVPMVSAAALPAAVAGQTLPSLAPMLKDTRRCQCSCLWEPGTATTLARRV